MRVNVPKIPVGTVRTVRRFLLFPLTLMNPDIGIMERRWWEHANIVEELQNCGSYEQPWYFWISIAWASEERPEK